MAQTSTAIEASAAKLKRVAGWGAHQSLALTALVVWAATLCRMSLGSVQESLRTALSLNDAQVAVLQGPALALPFVLLSIPVGALIDGYGRVRSLRLFGLLAAAGSILSAFATDYIGLLATRCLVGLAAMAVLTTSLSFIADLYAPHARGRAATVIALGQVFGTAGAFALGGLGLQFHFHGYDDWRSVQLGLAVLASCVLLSSFALREARSTESRAIDQPSRSCSLVALWQYRSAVGPIVCGIMMVAVADGAVLVWAVPFLSRSFSYDAGRAGVTVALLVAVSGIVGPVLGGLLADHCHRHGGPARTLYALAGVTFLSIPTGFFALATSALAAKALLFALVLAGNIVGVAATPLATVLVPQGIRGTLIAIMFAAGAVFGSAVAPVLVGLASSVVSGANELGHSLAWLCVSTSGLAAIAFMLGGRFLPRLPQ